MALVTPNLDDRQFQEIVDDARRRIPLYCKEWTDHNLSDPGITLIELFAWMTDMILYRLNQVPRLHYIKFMEMFGITLKGPQPAQTMVTFWLTAPQTIPLAIPAGVEVSSRQTEMETPIVFTTNRELRISPPLCSLVAAGNNPDDDQKIHLQELNLPNLTAGLGDVKVFPSVPEFGDALYFGFDNDLSNHLLGFDFDFDSAGGGGIKPSFPPYVWEAASADKASNWEKCEVDMDSTSGMNGPGWIRIHLPKLEKRTLNGRTHYWVRVNHKEFVEDENHRRYRVSPQMKKVSFASWGGDAPVTQCRTVLREQLGSSDGTPGQRFKLSSTPLLDRLPGEQLVVKVGTKPEQKWDEVNDFADSRESDLHYTLDSLSGELRFGPAVLQQDGAWKRYGAIPERQATLIFERYRYGGGLEGNIQPGVLNTLKTAIPYIARVSNRKPAEGGLDAESLESAMLRLPALLRTGDRAVTEKDYEFLAGEVLPIGRVKCFQSLSDDPAGAGKIFLLVIPRIDQPQERLKQGQLQFREEDQARLKRYLDERRMLGARLEIRPPFYAWTVATVRLKTIPGADKSAVEKEVVARLNRFLNPLVGGPEGTGWPFGRSLYASDIYPCLLDIPGVQYLLELTLYEANPGDGQPSKKVEFIKLPDHGVIASGIHSVQFE